MVRWIIVKEKPLSFTIDLFDILLELLLLSQYNK
jgi:hypothetical protein